MTAELLTAVAALAVAGLTLFLGRRDLTRPAVAFGVPWFLLVALAQVRLTELETPWPTGFRILLFAGGLAFMAAATLAGGTAAARGRIAVRREDYSARRLIAAALALCACGIAGTAYKADVLGGVPLLSGQADVLRSRAIQDGEVVVPAWSTALTDGFFLGLWCALAALWVMRGTSRRVHLVAVGLLAAGALFGTALLASRNTVLFAVAVPIIAAYLLGRPVRRRTRVAWWAAVAGVVVVVVGGLFVARLAEDDIGRRGFLNRELDRQPAVLKPIVPFYINGVYPFEAASRMYRIVPEARHYTYGASSLTSLPDAAFPEGKPPYGSTVAAVMGYPQRDDGLSWSVAGYQGRLLADAGSAGVMLGSLLLGLLLGSAYRWARAGPGFLAAATIAYAAYYAAFMAYDNLLSFTLIAGFDLAMVAAVGLYARGTLDGRVRSLLSADSVAGLERRAATAIDRVVARLEARPWPFLTIVLVLAAATWIYAGRGHSFIGDEWDIVYGRRGGGWAPYLSSHNEHPVMALVAYYKVMWRTVGIDEYWPYVVANVAAHLAAVALVFELFRRRAGVIPAFAAATLLAFFGRGFNDILWDFQMAFLASVLCGAGAFVLMQRRGLGRGVLACAALVVSIAWATWGLVFVGAIGVLLLLERRWRALAVPAVPFALYLAWSQSQYATARGGVQDLTGMPGFVADAFAITLANLGGLPRVWGRVLAVAAFVMLVAWLLRRRRPSPVQLAALSLPVLAWLLTAAGRAGEETPDAPRYAWPFAVFLLIAVAYVMPRPRLDSRAVAILAVITTGAVLSNLSTLREASAGGRAETRARLAQLGALDLARPSVSPDFNLTPLSWFGHHNAELYFGATDAYGSPGYDEQRLLELEPEYREQADRVLLQAATPRYHARARGRCRTAPVQAAEFDLTPKGVVVDPARGAQVRVFWRRFGDNYLPLTPVSERTGIVAPPTNARTPWKLRLESERPFELCGPPL